MNQPKVGIFRVSAPGLLRDFDDEEPALAAARAAVEAAARHSAQEAGAAEVEIAVDDEISAATVEGQRSFVEARVVATASGRPRIAD